jgi:NodT family efflux transporter outer membrane factor (OMF) lipoprotein
MKARIAAAAGLLLLPACSAPHYPAPPEAGVVPPAGWRTAIGPAAPIDQAWWRRFGDPVLTRLVETALANNPDIAIAAARVREARAQERLARAQLFPTLDAGAGVTRSRSVNAFGQPSVGTSVSPVFQASYEVDLFGRISDQVTAARQSFLASGAARDSAALAVASATASGYVALRGLDLRRRIIVDTIASRGEALRIARDRARVGYTSDLEFRQAEAEYQAAAQLLPQVDLAISRQEDALSLLLGNAPRAIERGLALAALTPPPVPAGLPSDLLRRRPDIAQAEYSLAASDSNLAAARAQFLPSLRLTGSTGEAISSLLGNPVTLFSLGASALAPLFEGGRLRAGAETAAARRDQAAFAYQRIVLTAFREVEDQLAAVVRLGEQRARLEAQRAALAEVLRHAANRYQAGYSPYLEQLDAQRNLLNADLALAQTRVDQLNALIALYQAMGGGWADRYGAER